MRALGLALAALLLLPGCLTGEPVQTASLSLDKLPEGAKVEPIAEGLRVVFDAVKLPFTQNFTVPEGTTMVRAHAIVDEGKPLSVVLRHAETNRRRCQTPTIESWHTARTGEMSCVALTAVDDLPATWKVVVGSAAAPVATVKVDLLTIPVDGLAARLDLAHLSKRVHELEETKIQMVPSFDGTLLHVEVTKPKVDGKVPAVIVSSPYTNAERMAGLRPSNDLILDWGARGYAIVVADVRGYGLSEGCVEVWSDAEQKDQKALVEWVAKQDWSDGSVGFYGQSYVGTTPVAAAVQAPEALKAIVTVAPVINAYDDWHFGGVPNGEAPGSALSYAQIGGGLETFPLLSTSPQAYVSFVEGAPEDAPYMAERLDNGFCDPALFAAPNDPRDLYDAFYVERNFSARAKDVKAAVLYTQGFEDTNVKSMMAAWWFNALPGPKLGLFGHWIHQHPPRADQETLFLAWMDQHVKGKPLGLERLPVADVTTNVLTHRESATWPYADAQETRLPWEATTDVLLPVDGGASRLTPLPGLAMDAIPAFARLVTKVDEPLEIAGLARLDLAAQLKGADNAYVAAFLYDKGPEQTRLVTFGMVNLAHRGGHASYEPVPPGETVRASLPFQPTDYVVEAGHELILEVRGALVSDWETTKPGAPGVLTIVGGQGGTALALPTLDAATALPAPATLDWVS